MSSDPLPRDVDSGDEEPMDGLVDRGLRALFAAAKSGEAAAKSGEAAARPRAFASSRVLGSPAPLETRTPRGNSGGSENASRERDTDGIPKRIGRYRIAGEIARGGVGVVLRGHDDEIGREVAVKVLLGEHSRRLGMSERLIAEAQVAGQLEHPAIVAVHEIGTSENGAPFLVMRLVRGRTLAALLEERASPDVDRQRFLSIFERVAEALAHAHGRGVVHRDLKPLNVMVGAFGEVQVMDWGLAKVIGDRGDSDSPRGPEPANSGVSSPADFAERAVRTIRSGSEADRSLSGSVLGTPAYMAPEQACGEVDSVGPHTDVFGLGAILCEILTGAPPYQSNDARSALEQARRADLADAHARLRASRADADLVRLALDCLASSPHARPKDAAYVAEAMASYLHSLEDRARKARLEAAEARVRAEGERKTRRLVTALGGLAIATAIGGATLFYWLEFRRRERVLSTERLVRQSIAEAENVRVGDDELDAIAIEAALRAARSANELIEERASEVSPELAERARGVVRSLELRQNTASLASRLERIRQRNGLAELSLSAAGEEESYEAAFAAHLGEDWPDIEVAEAARRLRETGAGAELSRYLLFQALREKRFGRDTTLSLWMRPLEIAQLADPDPLRTRLRRALAEGDGATIREIVRSPELRGASPLTLHALAIASAGAFDDSSELVAVWRRARELRPGDFWITSGLGRALRDALPPHLEEARIWLTAAVALRPGSGLARAMLANVELRLGNLEAATRTLHEALEADPESSVVVNGLGVLLDNAGDLAGAEDAFRRGLALSSLSASSRATLLANLGSIRFRRGDEDEAKSLYERALSFFPESVTANNGLGRLLFERGWRREAKAYFLRATASSDARSASWKNLGEALLDENDLEGAEVAFERAIELDPHYALAMDLLGSARWQHDNVSAAIDAFARSIEIDAQSQYAATRVLEILEKESTRIDADSAAIEHLRTAVELVADAGGIRNVPLALVYVSLWCLHPDPARRDEVVGLAEAIERQAGGASSTAVGLLARVRFVCGRRREAVRLAEAAASRASASSSVWHEDLARFREAVLPDLPTFQTIGRAVEALPEGVDLAASRELFASFREAAEGEDANARAEYLDLLLLDRAGAHGEALERLQDLIRRGPWSSEPYLRLWSLASAQEGDDAALERVHATFARATLPPHALPAAPLAPTFRIAFGPSDDGSLELVTGPFRALDPRVTHAATRWRVWVEGKDADFEPALDIITSGPEMDLALPPGFLMARTRYRAAAAQIGSDGRQSPYSEAVSIEAGDLAVEPVSFDLTSILDRDVIGSSNASSKNEPDAFDARGYRLISWERDGESSVTGEAVARGLPEGGRIGCHLLADPDRPNAFVILSGDTRAPVRLAVPRGRYAALRFLVAGANGASAVPVLVETREGAEPIRAEVPCADWFDDPGDAPLDSLSPHPTPVWNRMDRLLGATVEERADAALFEVLLPLEGGPEVEAIVFDIPAAKFQSAETRFTLFAVTGMRMR